MKECKYNSYTFWPHCKLKGRFSSVFCVKFGLIARRSSQQWVENLSELDVYQIFCAPAIFTIYFFNYHCTIANVSRISPEIT